MSTTTRRHGLALLLCGAVLGAFAPVADAADTCAKPLYLTFDTGHMGVAPLIAEVLAGALGRADGDSLDDHWAPWWKARAAEGHEFASHTYDHVYWRGDEPGAEPRFRVRPSAGPTAGRDFTWSAAQYCADIAKANARLAQITGKKPLPLFRAPGGKTSPKLLAAARACGYAHVGWAPAGFLGDELPSEKFGNERLLRQALDNVRAGDILIAHLGIWSRQDPWAPAVLEPLVAGLKAKGFCFRTLREHPDHTAWIAAHP
jgi:peptidoglycan/xylan/chitin deacetylase (PgdA/CDA1 family)